ncbi:MAG: helix-turn-helix transcriptional regulator, partial [Paracoccaceae bacterium]
EVEVIHPLVGKPMVVSDAPQNATGSYAPSARSNLPKPGRFDEKLVIVVIQFICSLVLVVDVGGEIHGTFMDDEPISPFMLFHLWIEGIATILMGVAFVLSYRQLRFHRSALADAKDRIEAVRGDFAELVGARFREWGLSPAEYEIALLTVKGLRIAEIAQMRDSRESTVKSHLSAIFKKASVASRTELLAKFVDEFLSRSSEL